MDKKKSGSYYTPQLLSTFIADYCLKNINDINDVSILEPSVGDGAFIKALSECSRISIFDSVKISMVEREGLELQKAEEIKFDRNVVLNSYHEDYLNFHFSDKNSYSLIIGNPPYVKKNHLTENQKYLAKKIHLEKQLSDKSIINIWTSFLISGIAKLTSNGMLAMILPLELLQMKFTEEVRTLLKGEFERIEIFTFNELQFKECKGQDTILLIGYKKHTNQGTYYTNINETNDLQQGKFHFYQNSAISNSERKWTHHFIAPEEYEFLEELKGRVKTVTNYVDNKAGIVTAANDFFIVNTNVLENYKLHDFAKPIVQKGYYVNGGITFKLKDFEKLIDELKPAYILDFNSLSDEDIPINIKEYLKIGEQKSIPNRFKCKQRLKWYKIPNISKSPQAFFFKRSHDYPKLLTNEASVLVTDSAYKIEVKEGYNIKDFIFSFYNSLTLTFAELEGRYYGGGVLELTPNEFRILPIPYVRCNDFEQYDFDFKNKSSIESVLNKYNYYILNTVLKLNHTEIDRLESIRRKLINKRHRK